MINNTVQVYRCFAIVTGYRNVCHRENTKKLYGGTKKDDFGSHTML